MDRPRNALATRFSKFVADQVQRGDRPLHAPGASFAIVRTSLSMNTPAIIYPLTGRNGLQVAAVSYHYYQRYAKIDLWTYAEEDSERPRHQTQYATGPRFGNVLIALDGSLGPALPLILDRAPFRRTPFTANPSDLRGRVIEEEFEALVAFLTGNNVAP